MSEKEKLAKEIYKLIEHLEICEICKKMCWNCPVEIPENPDNDFHPDFTKCNFKENYCRVLSLTNSIE